MYKILMLPLVNTIVTNDDSLALICTKSHCNPFNSFPLVYNHNMHYILLTFFSFPTTSMLTVPFNKHLSIVSHATGKPFLISPPIQSIILFLYFHYTLLFLTTIPLSLSIPEAILAVLCGN